MICRITLVLLVGILLGPRLHAQPAQQPVSSERTTLWRELRTLKGHRAAIWCVAFSADGKLPATSTPSHLGPPGEFKIWDLASGRETLSIQAGPSVRCVSFAPDCKSFATAERLLAVKPDAAAKQIAALIAQLDDDDFDVRQKASGELAKLGHAAVPHLKTALDKRPTPEAKQSIEGLLANVNQT